MPTSRQGHERVPVGKTDEIEARKPSVTGTPCATPPEPSLDAGTPVCGGPRGVRHGVSLPTRGSWSPELHSGHAPPRLLRRALFLLFTVEGCNHLTTYPTITL